MTNPDLTAGSDGNIARPVPDTDDLRILAELINNDSIPLAQAAWNARMSQYEAAARLLTMAERGMPLRLVADGDRNTLWRIAQAGPATGAVRAAAPEPQESIAAPGTQYPPSSVPPPPPGPQFGPPSSTPMPPPADPTALAGLPTPPTPMVPQTSTAGPPTPDQAASQPTQLPPASAVPPHEQAIAGAVPLGEPPFGTAGPESPATEDGELPPADPTASSGQEAEPDPASPADPDPAPPADDQGPAERPASGPTPAASSTPPESQPTPRGPVDLQPTGPRSQSVLGLFGERLTVTLFHVLDPSDSILAGAGVQLEPGHRAVMVETVLANEGTIDHESPADLYLILDAANGEIHGRSGLSVPGFPGHPGRAGAGQSVAGWTVFVIPGGLALGGVRWSVRPDLPAKTLAWRF